MSKPEFSFQTSTFDIIEPDISKHSEWQRKSFDGYWDLLKHSHLS